MLKSPWARLTSRMTPKTSDETGGEQRVQAAEQDPLDDVVDPDHPSHSEVGRDDLLRG